MALDLCKIGMPTPLFRLMDKGGDITKFSMDESGQYLEFVLRTISVMSENPKLKIDEIKPGLLIGIAMDPEFNKLLQTITNDE